MKGKVTRGAYKMQSSDGVFVYSFIWTQALGELQPEAKGEGLEGGLQWGVQKIPWSRFREQKQGSVLHHKHGESQSGPWRYRHHLLGKMKMLLVNTSRHE